MRPESDAFSSIRSDELWSSRLLQMEPAKRGQGTNFCGWAQNPEQERLLKLDILEEMVYQQEVAVPAAKLALMTPKCL